MIISGGILYWMIYGNLYQKHPPRKGLTVSSFLVGTGSFEATYFSLGSHTSISRESYPVFHLYVCLGGELLLDSDKKEKLCAFDCFLCRPDVLIGMDSLSGTGYIDVLLKEDHIRMNDNIQAGKVFHLADLVDYEEDSVVNMDVMHNDKMKLAVMAFDKGQSLSAHKAPGDAVLFILEGEAVISYEGKDYPVKKGDEFCFKKNGLHALKATERFKMALLLSLD